MQPTLDDVWVGANFAELPDEVILRLRRRYRMVMEVAIGACYAVDVLFLYLFAQIGRVPDIVPLGYGLAGLVHVGIFSALHWSGYTERLRNPHMSSFQMTFAIVVQLVAMTVAPQIKAYFLAIIFVIFAFAALRLTLRGALAMWLLACLATGYTLMQLPPNAIGSSVLSRGEAFIVAASFSVVLLRVLLLNYYGTLLRTRMVKKTVALSEQVRVAQEMATHDRLTGALNRYAILPMLEDQIQMAIRKNIPCVVTMIDIDHFKAVNDHFGHLVGDVVLHQLVSVLEVSLRPTDKVARYGGEEFLILMPCTAFAEGCEIVERVRDAVARVKWGATAPGLKVTLSAGVTDVAGEDSVNGILARADACLYQAKNTGRNRSVSLPAGQSAPMPEKPAATVG